MKLISPNGHQVIEIYQDEIKNIYLEDFSNKSVNFELEIYLKEKNAKVNIEGRIQNRTNENKKWNIKVYFQGTDQKCSLKLHGIAEDNSQLIFDGGIILTQNSNNGEAEIIEKIILFNNAQGKCIPTLKVETNNVKKASHSACIMPFDEEQILFATSRGIPQKKAIKAFKKGFLEIITK